MTVDATGLVDGVACVNAAHFDINVRADVHVVDDDDVHADAYTRIHIFAYIRI